MFSAPPEQCENDALEEAEYCIEHIETPLDYVVEDYEEEDE